MSYELNRHLTAGTASAPDFGADRLRDGGYCARSV